MSRFNTGKMASDSVNLVSVILGGALAGAIFARLWHAVCDTEEPPQATALDRNIREVLLAGVLQGAVFGLVKVALGRMAARGYRRATGHELAP